MRFCYILIACSVFVLFSSRCTVQKRHYRHGYFVDGHLTMQNKATLRPEFKQKGKKHTSFPEPITTNIKNQSFNESSAPFASLDTKPLVNTKQFDAENCDSLFLKDGTVLEVKIKEVGFKDIRYKLCDFQDGPDYLVEKFRVSSIRFVNGKQELFNESAPPLASKNKTTDTPASITSEKNSNAALALSFGILGIYPLIFIGSIIGIIFGIMAMNDFKTNPGRYSNETMGKVGLGLSIGGLIFWIGIVIILLFLL